MKTLQLQGGSETCERASDRNVGKGLLNKKFEKKNDGRIVKNIEIRYPYKLIHHPGCYFAALKDEHPRWLYSHSLDSTGQRGCSFSVPIYSIYTLTKKLKSI